MKKEPIEELKEGFVEFKTKNQQSLDEINALIKTSQEGNQKEIKAAVDKAEAAVKQVQDVADRLVEAEQKLVSGVLKGKEAPKSLGVLVAESDEFKNYASGKTSKCRIVLKNGFDVNANTITGQTGSPPANSDILVPAQRMSGVIPGAFRRLRVRDVLPSGNTSSNAVEFTRELTFTNNAAETAEGAQKPESILTFELYTTPVRTIAHFIKVSKQVKDDAPLLISYINNRMLYGVELREEQQLVAGDGVGQNLIGMTISPNMTAYTPVTGNALDNINRSKYIIDNADYLATGIIMNPTDWGNIERLKVGSSDDRYIIGDPRSPMGPFLWGLPVVVTPSMTAGKLLVAAFDVAFMYLLREDAVVEMFEQDDTNAQKNLLTIRAEKRSVLGGLRPASVRYGNLTL